MKNIYINPTLEIVTLADEDVISTSTHFVLKKYKDKGVIYGAAPEVDERELFGE